MAQQIRNNGYYLIYKSYPALKKFFSNSKILMIWLYDSGVSQLLDERLRFQPPRGGVEGDDDSETEGRVDSGEEVKRRIFPTAFAASIAS